MVDISVAEDSSGLSSGVHDELIGDTPDVPLGACFLLTTPFCTVDLPLFFDTANSTVLVETELQVY